MAGTPLLDRLTAPDLFLLLWDDYGWSAGSSSRDCTWSPGSGSCCPGPG
jgi:hypothetical protein